MKGVYSGLFLLLMLSGCSSEQNQFTTTNKNREISEKKPTIREIDSITADYNFSFNKKNIITPAERKKLLTVDK